MTSISQAFGRIVFASTVLALSIGYLAIAGTRLGFGALTRPGPALWPVLVGLAAIAVSIVTILEAYAERVAAGEADWPRGAGARKAALLAAIIAGYVVGLKLIGFAASAFLAATAIMVALGGLAWWRAALYSAAMTAIAHTFFVEFLYVRFPPGLAAALLGAG